MNRIDKLSNLHIKIVGVNLENLLFDLTCAGILLKHVKRKNKTLKFVVSGQNYEQVLNLSKKHQQKVFVTKQSGIANVIKSIPYSIGAFVGIIISCFYVYFATSTIAKIDVEIIDRQNQVIEDENKNVQITSYLQDIGIGKGKNYVGKIKNAENLVAGQFDFVESCIISKTGNYVKVTIKQAVSKTIEQSTICATQNGIVESIVTFAGKAKVKAGDIVRQGQVLVEAVGKIMPKAQIKIKTWAVGTVFHYDSKQVVVRTGKKQVSKLLRLWDWQIVGHSACKFATFETEVVLASIENMLPIEIETLVFYETKVIEINESFEQNVEQIKEKAKNEAMTKSGGKATNFTYSIMQENGASKVDCYAEFVEEIVVK